MPSHNHRWTALAGSARRASVIAALAAAAASGCRQTDSGSIDPTVTLLPPGGATRTIDFEIDEGTGMSVDVSPDGSWIAFDLLGHVYRMPIEGGRAVALTQNSGPALNFHPAISPDGKRIAFVSDRNGQLNIWTMAADGSDPRVIVADPDTRFLQPAWAPDGGSIVAVRLFRTPGRSWHRQNRTLYRMPAEGGAAEPVIEERLTQPDSPAFSADGRHLYYHVSYSIAEGLGMLTAGHRILRREVATGTLENVRLAGPAELTPEFRAALKGGGYATDVGDEPAVTTPKPSPDGKWLAFSREMPEQTFEWRGHRMRPATALWVRNLETGEERVALGTATKDLTQINTQYAYRPFPGYAWMPDSRSIILTVDGKIQRLDVESGALTPIPFTARVLRTLAEPVRSKLKFRDDSLDVRFIQWPASSADGRRLAFVAAGRIWTMDLPGGRPRALLDQASDGVELTPVWSPDGKTLAFTTWSEAGRGHLWTVEPGQPPRRISTEPGEYLGPVWSGDGRSIAVSRGPGPRPGEWNPWDRADGWRLVGFPAAGGSARDLAAIGAWGIAALGPGGRLSFPAQDHPDGGSPLLFKPFPDSSAIANVVRIRTIGWDGELPASHLEFPARLGRGNTPVWSPEGNWVAFDAAHEIFVTPIGPAGSESRIEVDPNVAVADRRLVGTWGGIYPRWRNATTLEFASGNRYVAYEPATGKLTTTEVKLLVPKPEPEGSIALVGAKIVTVDSQGVIDRGTIVVTGSRISCVGACDTSGVTRVVDLTGKTIIPGLIDLHAHHSDEVSGVVPTHRPASALALAYGVTTVVDPATTSEGAFPVADAIEVGAVVGPRTLSSAEFVISPGIAWGDYRSIATLADAQAHVDRRAAWGAVTIKNYRQPGRKAHQLLAAAARSRGVSLTSEGGPLYLDVGYAIDGQTGWEHMIADLPLYGDATTFFGKAGLVYSPTLIVAGVPHGTMEYFRPAANLLADPKIRRFTPYPIVAGKVAAAKPKTIEEVAFPIMAEGVADIVKAGGFAAIGEHGEQPGLGSHWELWTYATALSPLQALKVATWDGAWFIGAHDEIGSIRAGKLADLIILDADPLVDIRNSIRIGRVMRAGRLYDADSLDELWPGNHRYGPVPWPTDPVR